jgi:hypothetical protein
MRRWFCVLPTMFESYEQTVAFGPPGMAPAELYRRLMQDRVTAIEVQLTRGTNYERKPHFLTGLPLDNKYRRKRSHHIGGGVRIAKMQLEDIRSAV